MKFYSTTAKQYTMLTNQRPLNQIPNKPTYGHQYGIFGLNRRLDERGETAVSIRYVTHS